MRRSHAPLLIAVTLAVPGPARAQAAEPDLAAVLAEAVDLPTPAARRARARQLARRREWSVHELVLAMSDFGEFVPAESGLHEEHVPLQVGDATEHTELFVYVPGAYDPGEPAPLIAAFHGTGGNGRRMHRMWQATAERLGALVLAPSEAGPNDGYRFSVRERQAALAALRWVRRHYNVDEDKILGTGISRGGHLVWDLALRRPDLFCAIMPMIGSPRITLNQGQNNFRYLENLARLPIRDLQGAQDDPAMVFSLRLAFEMLDGYGASDAKLIEFPDLGHSFDPSAVDWEAFVREARRDAQPDGCVRRCTARGRAFWIEVLQTEKDVQERFTPRIPAGEWSALDEEGQRRRLVEEALRRTARLEVWMRTPGRFEARSEGVAKFRILLSPGMFDESQPVEVAYGGKTRKKKLRADREVLLADFVERFDRRFLPVAELEVR